MSVTVAEAEYTIEQAKLKQIDTTIVSYMFQNYSLVSVARPNCELNVANNRQTIPVGEISEIIDRQPMYSLFPFKPSVEVGSFDCKQFDFNTSLAFFKTKSYSIFPDTTLSRQSINPVGFRTTFVKAIRMYKERK